MSKINMGEWNAAQESLVIGAGHDPIVLSCRMKPGVGKLPAGTLVTIDPSTALSEKAKESNAASLFGVLTVNYDETDGAMGQVLVHGIARRAHLEQVKGGKLTSQEVAYLIKTGVYPL